MKQLASEEREQIIRRVGRIGNGAHIFMPKEWAEEQVLVVRIEKKSIKEQIFEILMDNLDKVISVVLYGSQARGESGESSDIDILVIAKEKFKVSKNGFDVIVLEEKEFEKALKINPILIYSIFQEGIALINSKYFEKLKELKIDKSLFKEFVKNTKKAIISNKEILELDKKTGKTASNSVIYSLVLRLRGMLIINNLLKNRDFSNNLFKKWLKENCSVDYEEIYSAYNSVRDDKKKKDKILIKDAECLNDFLEKEIKKLEKLI